MINISFFPQHTRTGYHEGSSQRDKIQYCWLGPFRIPSKERVAWLHETWRTKYQNRKPMRLKTRNGNSSKWLLPPRTNIRGRKSLKKTMWLGNVGRSWRIQGPYSERGSFLNLTIRSHKPADYLLQKRMLDIRTMIRVNEGGKQRGVTNLIRTEKTRVRLRTKAGEKAGMAWGA